MSIDSGSAPQTSSSVPANGVTINHHLIFSGPGYVPTGTDETSARETTGGTEADVGSEPTVLSLTLPAVRDVPTWNA